MYARTLAAFAGIPAFAQDAMAGAGQSMSHDAMHETAAPANCATSTKDSMQHASMKHDSMQHDSMQHDAMQGATHKGCAMQKDGMQHPVMQHGGMMKQHDAMKPASSGPMGHGG